MKNLHSKIFTTFLFLFLVSFILKSCTSEEANLINGTQKRIFFNNETIFFKEIARQFYVDENVNIELDITNIQEKVLNHNLHSFLEAEYTLLNLEDLSPMYFEINTPDGFFQINSVSLQAIEAYSNENKFKEIVHLSNDKGLDLIVELELEDNGNGSLTSGGMVTYSSCYGSYSLACVDSNGDGRISYGECFGACMGYAFDTNEMLGKMIVITGVSTVFCQGCGIVSAALVAAAALGCAGGCVSYA